MNRRRISTKPLPPRKSRSGAGHHNADHKVGNREGAHMNVPAAAAALTEQWVAQ